MKYGTNYFPFNVIDASGANVTLLTLSDFVVSGSVNNVALEATSSSESPSGSGFYLIGANIPVGQGYIAMAPVNTTYTSSPQFYAIDTTIYDEDDLYSSIARQSLNVTQTAINNYESQTIGPYKEGDDWDITYVVPDSVAVDISGYSNFKATLSADTILTSISGGIGDFNLTVTVPTKTIRMVLPSAISSNIVDSGVTEQYFYSDLECLTDEGLKKTLAEFTILVRRNFTL